MGQFEIPQLPDVEVELIGDLEIGPVHQDQVAADKKVREPWSRGGQHDFQLVRQGCMRARSSTGRNP